jgi:dienelactone hydrolase
MVRGGANLGLGSWIPALLLASALDAQENPDAAIRAYLKGKAAELERDFFPQIKKAEEFEKLRPRLVQEYFEMLGLWPLPERTPLAAAVTGRIEGEGFTVEKLHYQSRPGLYVTANLYLPRPAEGRHPAILYLCGHSGRGRDGNKTAFQDHGIWFATHGYVCLVLDTLQLGEVAGIHHGTYRFERWWWPSLGYTPAGVECWNAVRGLDYLAGRPEVDAERIGATGISGGGAATFWVSAADDRVKVAVPVSGMADLGFYVGEDGVNGHCDCMFLVNSARWNWSAIAALVCPRPMLFANSDADGIFPMSANERVINRLERLYAHFGAGDRVEAVVSVGGHDYRTDLRRSIFEFFNRHLKGDARRVEDADAGLGADGKPSRIPSGQLRVFPEDKDLPADALNGRIDETFTAAAKVEPPGEGQFEAWRKGLVDRLRAASFAAWPEAPARAAASPAAAEGRLATEPGIEAAWRRLGGKQGERPWLIVLEEGEAPGELPAWARPLVGEAPALLVAPRGGWTRKNPPNTVERSMALLGTTADAGRVFDVIATARSLGGPWTVAGRRQAGILGAYAALYEPSLERVVLVEPPASHRRTGPEGAPTFLGVLRVLDIPEALACLAPRPLSLVGAKEPAAFDRTAEIYKGAGGKLDR